MKIKILIRVLTLAGCALASSVWALSCTATTPEQAAQAWIGAQSMVDVSATQTKILSGYRVERVMTDAAMHKQWALIASCEHPAHPLIAVELPRAVRSHSMQAHVETASYDTSTISIQLPVYVPVVVHPGTAVTPLFSAKPAAIEARPQASPMLVHAGDRVVLWNREPELHLAIAAVSLEYGREGQIIHLRRDNPGTLQNVTMTGVVRGPGSVELMP